uniref:TFIIS N-terminal domain-containing protein n=1 Tax=Dunaliella tertiolecta TaxID=3047 RepID=A0A7S3QQ61_DUNTE
MDKYISQWQQKSQNQSGSSSSNSGLASGVAKRKPGKQQKLQDLAKVHILQSSSRNPRIEDVIQIRSALEQAVSNMDEAELLHQLQRLACYELTHELLVESQIGPVVRQLRGSSQEKIARLASNIVEKLRKVVKRQAKVQMANPLPNVPIGNAASRGRHAAALTSASTAAPAAPAHSPAPGPAAATGGAVGSGLASGSCSNSALDGGCGTTSNVNSVGATHAIGGSMPVSMDSSSWGTSQWTHAAAAAGQGSQQPPYGQAVYGMLPLRASVAAAQSGGAGASHELSIREQGMLAQPPDQESRPGWAQQQQQQQQQYGHAQLGQQLDKDGNLRCGQQQQQQQQQQQYGHFQLGQQLEQEGSLQWSQQQQQQQQQPPPLPQP